MLFRLGMKGIQVTISAAKARDLVVVVNKEGIVNRRVKSDSFTSINHVGQTKDVGYMILIKIDRSVAWDVGLDIQRSNAGIGLHVDLASSGANVSDK